MTKSLEIKQFLQTINNFFTTTISSANNHE